MTASAQASRRAPAARTDSEPGPAPKWFDFLQKPLNGSSAGDLEPQRVDGDWERPPPTARQQRVDVMIGVLLAVGTVLSALLSRSLEMDINEFRPSQGEETLWALAVCLPLCLRRRYPLAVLIACSIAFIGLQARFVGESTFSSICLFTALYTAGAWGRNRRITVTVRIVVIVTMFCWLAYAISATAWIDSDQLESAKNDGPIPARTAAVIYQTVVNILYFGAAWAFGNAAWAQQKQRAELAERNRELQIERDENAHRAVIAERVRIARELHDVVAHHVSVMGVQAGAARRVLDRDPRLAERTLSSIEAAGRSAVEEMHRLLGVLREGDLGDGEHFDRSPAPGLDQLEALVNQACHSGPAATLTVVGEPRSVPQSISVSLYRITQEALTNTVRHAGATRVDVRLRYLDAAVEVEIVDDGRGRSPAANHSGIGPGPGTEGRVGNVHKSSSGSGLGHVGMRERIAMHDGHLEVGPRPDGGYRVRARFPIS
jgi:signal transduction histidine kinase